MSICIFNLIDSAFAAFVLVHLTELEVSEMKHHFSEFDHIKYMEIKHSLQ